MNGLVNWIWGFLILTACSQKAEQSQETFLEDGADREIVISTELSEPIQFNDFADLQFIQLETSDSVLLSRPSKILKVGSNLIILDKRLNAVLRFDEQGQFLNRIGQNGDGPGEYRRPMDILWDDRSRRLKVLVNSHSGYFAYDLKGNYYSKQTNSFFTIGFAQCGEQMAWFNGYNSDTHNLYLTDGIGEVVDRYFPYDPSNYRFGIDFSGGISNIQNGGFLYAETADPVIYEFDSDMNLSHKYRFDLGPLTWPGDRKTELDAFWEKVETFETAYLGSQFYSNNWGLVFDYYDKNHGYAFYSYNDGELYARSSLANDPLAEILWAPCGFGPNQFISFLNPAGFDDKTNDFQQRIHSDYPILYDLLTDRSRDYYDNPIVVVLTFNQDTI
ncbi:6-bladed beta-propeller [Marinoscillum sp.]|uniref:6-bladed beta-propeller n=1 Tax=Marinoscillum sp. TaxID=2024838 RepID=UPI003BA9C044